MNETEIQLLTNLLVYELDRGTPSMREGGISSIPSDAGFAFLDKRGSTMLKELRILKITGTDNKTRVEKLRDTLKAKGITYTFDLLEFEENRTKIKIVMCVLAHATDFEISLTD